MYNDIYQLAETGQFDNAENDETEIVEIEQIEKLEINDSSDYELDEDQIESFELKTGKSQFKADNQLHYSSWADKMDLLKVKSNSKSTDKSDNATYDRVLDDRSKTIMFKMMRQKIFSSVNGNISAGKEANVYHAPTESGEDLVIKVYMTSIMPFRKRDRYMNGDFRFRNANLSSSTKLVTNWAEKEFRNLIRISETNGLIPCPRPIKQKSMVLVMSMIGSMGDAAPKLKDVEFETEEEWVELYEQIVKYVRVLFQNCRLIHADLSEYNLLYHDGKIWMIDVSQSVEHFHPEALNFLRKDCHTMNTFFRNKGIKTVSLREFFDFVVDPTICSTSNQEELSIAIKKLIEQSDYYQNAEEDEFFLHCHIPRNLNDVLAFVKDYKKLRSDSSYIANCPYAAVTGMTEELRDIRPRLKKSMKTHKAVLKNLKMKLKEDEIESEENKEEDEENDLNIENVETIVKTEDSNNHLKRPLNETTEEKKLRKQQIKENQREKRKENKQNILKEKARTIPGFKRRNLKQ